MASTAVRTELSIMHIPGRMTGVAIEGRPFEDTVRMTGIAGHVAMLSGQWEARVAVIEAYRTPALCGVASTAIRTKLSTMSVIGSVAGITVRWRTFEDTVRVAG